MMETASKGLVEEPAGKTLPNLPADLIKRFGLEEISRRYRHWIAKGRDGIYKLAPKIPLRTTHIEAEGAILEQISHRNIISGTLYSEDRWDVLLLPWIEGEPLTTLRSRLSTREKHRILEEVGDAVAFLNGRGFLHADICADNVLWTGRQSYLIDFEEAVPVMPLAKIDSPDFIGGPPCCWGNKVYGYPAYHCLDSMRKWLLTPEFLDLERELTRTGIWSPNSIGNTCDPWSTLDDGSIYQTVVFGNRTVKGQRDPDLRFRYLTAGKQIDFEDATILDIGCNFGRLGAFLDQLNIQQYVGVDLNPDYISVAQKLAQLEGRQNVTFVVGDVCDVATLKRLQTAAPEPFDIVICQSVYHHFINKNAFWQGFTTLAPRWFIFESPTDDAKYLLTGSWEEEKNHIRSLGYRLSWESTDNDFAERTIAVFQRLQEFPEARADVVAANLLQGQSECC